MKRVGLNICRPQSLVKDKKTWASCGNQFRAITIIALYNWSAAVGRHDLRFDWVTPVTHSILFLPLKIFGISEGLEVEKTVRTGRGSFSCCSISKSMKKYQLFSQLNISIGRRLTMWQESRAGLSFVAIGISSVD